MPACLDAPRGRHEATADGLEPLRPRRDDQRFYINTSRRFRDPPASVASHNALRRQRLRGDLAQQRRKAADPADWTLERLSGKTTINLIYPNLAGETTVWARCAYLNGRNETGPASPPVCVRLPGNGLVAPAGQLGGDAGQPMKIAA